MNAVDVVRLLNLAPLEGEGGFYRQTWHTGDASRPGATAIYYLVTPESFSALHRLSEDEIFHFYAGDPCEMIQVSPDGVASRHLIGVDLEHGQRPQMIVEAGSWQGTKLVQGGAWALLGTTMAPGFSPDMFELATPELLDGFSDDARRAVAPFMPARDW
jgi:predicted cupin superfamily sugar epimerase